LPDDLATGTYYISAWSDSYDVVFEDTLATNLNPDDPNEIDSNNYSARAVQILGKDKPDLSVSNVQAPSAQAGQPLTVSWTVQNQGEPFDNSTYDGVWISSTPNLEDPGNQRWFLGAVKHTGGLGQGQSYTAQQTFTLATVSAGRVCDRSG